ncbi:TPA: hypothetical protein R4057_002031 [Kluyvera ascorbata]|uniref:Gp49 family protein n=1 Tax=Kluyvera ascorbata TaxID=51288 RepID=UPI002897B98E|nr:Gp49 family protein [Kluyvera ascorbata]HED3065078.1 hypothetical protein [Kluyvera ascorbata]
MAKNPEAVEAKMVVLGCTGRRVTMDLIKLHIDSVEYETVTINGQKMMFCGIKMDNGFVVVGKPATCIDPANWREEIGQQVSYDNSFEELWKLEAYRLMSERPRSPLVEIARIAHEVNRAYCQANGDDSQPTWENAPDWQRDSATNGVNFHLTGDHDPAASHESWLAQKQLEGWKYGPVKDADKKEHPYVMPYDQLPAAQRVKDYLFRAVVHAFK